jgi:hypothetical protein
MGHPRNRLAWFWLTPCGLKPWEKKMDTILHMDRPRTATDLLRFIGCVNFYRDMWPSHYHILAPLTPCSGMKKNAVLTWTSKMQDAFDKIRLLMAADAISAYPYYNKQFGIFTDSSDYQMGACIMQEGRPVAYYSTKLNSAQKNTQQLKKKCCQSSQLSKSSNTCSSVPASMSTPIIRI